MQYGRYVVEQIRLGIQDNLNALWQIVRHPLDTLAAFFKAVIQPIKTIQTIWEAMKKSPLRFFTNLALSFLEGRLLLSGWQKVSEVVQISEQASASLHAVNSTMVASQPVLQEGAWQGFLNIFSNAPKPCCAASSCSPSLASSAVAPTATTVLETEGNRQQPNLRPD